MNCFFESIFRSSKITARINELTMTYLNYETVLKSLKCNSIILQIEKYALCHDFKKATSQTVVQYINNYRCQKAISFLEKGYSVTEVSIMCGFENGHFSLKLLKNILVFCHLNIIDIQIKKWD